MKKSLFAVAASLVLLVGALGCSSEEAAPAGGSGLNVDGAVGLSAAVSLAESHIQSLVSSMEALAMTKEVRAGDWEGMRELLARFQQGQIPALIWFVLPDGSYYSVDQGKTSANLSDRSYFPGLMAGNTVLGDLVVSKSTGKKSMIAAVPVKSNDKVIGGLGASVYLDSLSELLVQELGLTNGMVFYAVNGQGDIVLHRDTKWLMEKASALGSQAFTDAVAEMASQKEGKITYKLEGASETVVYKTSSLTGWCFALGIKGK